LAERYLAGESVPALAASFGIHRTTVLEHLERRGVQRRPKRRKLSDAQVIEATRAYAEGASLKELGAQLGVSAETVRNELARAGGPIRPPGRPARPGGGASPTTVQRHHV
jgi:predicted ArsR family transcriptional regulator